VRICSVVVVALAATLAGCSSTSTVSPQAGSTSAGVLAAGSTHSILDAHDQLALPLPRLASDVSVKPNADGSLAVTFSVAYAVANTHSAHGVRADDADIVVRVARDLLPNGPAPDPVFTKEFVDNHLGQPQTTHSYTVTIPAGVVSFLRSKGLSFVKSASGSTTTTVPSSSAESTDALRMVSVDIEQHRDFRHVDGSYDWTEGNFFTAASHPLQVATTHSGTLTVTNETSQICTYANSGSVTNYGDPDTFSNCQSSGLGTPIQLSGVATECFNQDTDSNPEGFAQTNSAGTGTPLAVGTDVTEPVVANDGIGLFSSSTEAVNANWAVTVGKAAVTTAANVLAGGPFGTIIEAGMALAGYFSGGSCDNDPNVMTLSATDTAGAAGASYGWAIDEEGMQDIYGTSFGDGNGGPLKAVQLAYSSQVYDNNGNYQNPWLAEQVTRNCGVGNGTSACSDATNSEVNIEWTTNEPCPDGSGAYTFNGEPQGGNAANCAATTTTSPNVSSCGTNNSTCPSQTPPQPAAVPNIVGDTYSQAVSALAKNGLGIYPTNISATEIIASQTPGPSSGIGVETPYVVQVTATTPAATTTTSPPPTVASGGVTVPNLVGLSISAASNECAIAGLGFKSNYPDGTVTSQSPAAGQEVASGTTVTTTSTGTT